MKLGHKYIYMYNERNINQKKQAKLDGWNKYKTITSLNESTWTIV